MSLSSVICFRVTRMPGSAQSDDDDISTTHNDSDLVSVVVEYDDRPDQCTIYDPETSGLDRMSSWITADRDAVVDLYHAR